MSKLSEKVEWAYSTANTEFAAGNLEGAARLMGYIRKIYPGDTIPAWAREKTKFAYTTFAGQITVLGPVGKNGKHEYSSEPEKARKLLEAV